jgi:gamma-glutamyltranspeptidase
MPILTNSIAVGAQIPTAGTNIGGGLIVAIDLGAGGNSTNYDLEYSRDGGTTWGAVCDEAGTAIQLVYTANKMYQINPPVRAPFFRLNGDANEADAVFTYYIHTV